jgi:CubicO group peptidase (beta-lactamase class C family)
MIGQLFQRQGLRALPIALAAAFAMGTPSVSASAVNVDRFAGWADRTFSAAYAHKEFSGMALIVVNHDGVVLQRTYGLASHAPDRPIDPVHTHFLIGSITKTFTGLAIAQLVERGQIRSIDDAANLYLKRTQLKGPWGSKITIRDLLTHSAGFDYRNRGAGTARVVPTPLTGRDIDQLAPAYIRPPGEIIQYSNYSAGILAALVEDVAGTDIRSYFRGRIWRPLGMTSTDFQTGLEPLPGTIRPFKFKTGTGWVEEPFIPFNPFYWPVGSITSTLPDMAAYARFHLIAGEGRDTPILTARQHAELQKVQRTSHIGVGGFGYQTMSYSWNGKALFGHGGTWPGYESMLIVDPVDDLAIFFSIAGPAAMGNLRATSLVDQALFGDYAAPGPVKAMSSETLSAYTGLYRTSLRSHAGVERLLNYLGRGDGLRIAAKGGGLYIGQDGPFMNVGEDLFWTPHAVVTPSNPFGSPVFAFKRDASGAVRYLIHQEGLGPLEKVSWWEDPALRIAALKWLSWASLLGIGMLAWPKRRPMDWLRTMAALTPAAALFGLAPLFLANFGASSLEADLIEGANGRFLIACALADGVAVSAVVLWWSVARATSIPNWRPWMTWNAAALGAVATLATLIYATIGILGWIHY